MKRADRKPNFFWQGVLILLPTIALVAIAVVFVARDRARVEDDAAARARELAQQIEAVLPGAVASWLSDFEARGNGWLTYQRDGLAVWAGGSTNAAKIRAWTDESIHAHTNLLEGNRWPDLWPIHLIFTPSGDLVTPPANPSAPEPQGWQGSLAPEIAERWEKARLLSSREAPPEALSACEELLRMTPSREVRANARLLRAVYLSARTNREAAEEMLLWVAEHETSARTESGIRVASVALAQAMNGATSLNERLFAALRSEVARASIFTPRLLERARALGGTNPAQSKAVEALQELWAADERRRMLADRLQKLGLLTLGAMPTNVWFDVEGTLPFTRWLALMHAQTWIRQTGRATNGAELVESNLQHTVRVYPKPVIERAFVESLERSRIELPPYLGISGTFAGEPIDLGGGGRPEMARALAEASRALRLKGVLLPAGTPVESFPSEPSFVLTVELASPALLHAAGRERMLWLSALIAVAAAAALFGLVAAHRAFHRQLRLAELKSNFVSSVSHELRAPIASVRLMAEGLERGAITEPSKEREYYRFIVQECRRLSSMIENVLDFARIDQGRKEYEFEPTDAGALVHQTVKLMQPYADDRQVTLRCESPASCAAVIDPQAIQQALVNLIDNAIKHSPAGESVMVELAGCDNNGAPLTLSVTDRGRGIPQAEHGRIFERFYRLGSELRRETPGAGIGLSIVKHVAEAHGGRVLLESEPGRGSTFTLELPSALNGEGTKLHD